MLSGSPSMMQRQAVRLWSSALCCQNMLRRLIKSCMLWLQQVLSCVDRCSRMCLMTAFWIWSNAARKLVLFCLAQCDTHWLSEEYLKWSALSGFLVREHDIASKVIISEWSQIVSTNMRLLNTLFSSLLCPNAVPFHISTPCYDGIFAPGGGICPITASSVVINICIRSASRHTFWGPFTLLM